MTPMAMDQRHFHGIFDAKIFNHNRSIETTEDEVNAGELKRGRGDESHALAVASVSPYALAPGP